MITSNTCDPPKFYVSIEQDYCTLTKEVAVAYGTKFGRFWISGKDALDLLNRISTQQIDNLKQNEVSFTVQTTNKGRIIDFLTVINLGDRLLIFTALEAKERVMESIDFFSFDDDVRLHDCTAETQIHQLMGHKAPIKIMSVLEDESNVPDLFTAKEIIINNEKIIIIRTDRAKIPTYEILSTYPSKVIDSKIKSMKIPFVGTEALEILRIEAGVPAYGSELSEKFNPIEAGLFNSISFEKGCYVGQEVVARLNTYDKVKRELIRLNWSEPGIQKGDIIFSKDKEIGEVTSCVMKMNRSYIGLGYITRNSNLDVIKIGLNKVSANTLKI